MANDEHLAILQQGVKVWNKVEKGALRNWRKIWSQMCSCLRFAKPTEAISVVTGNYGNLYLA